MQAFTQIADDGEYVITRGCSQMSRVPQKINNIVEIFSLWMYIADAKRPGGIGSIRTLADKGGGGSKLGKILRTSFMYDP